MASELRTLVRQAFLDVHEGRSTDDVVIDPELNERFLVRCRAARPELGDADFNWALLNLRKSANLGSVTRTAMKLNHAEYAHAAQIAARLMEDRFQLTIDRVLCDPVARDQFDAAAAAICPDVSRYGLRKAALGLRKARRLRPEIVKRVANWGRVVREHSAGSLRDDPERIPRQPGVYLFRDDTGYLYIGEAGSLRPRVAKHLDHSDRKSLAHYLWEQGIARLTVELHVFDGDSDARLQGCRRAYESDLIAHRQPRFNLKP